MRLAFHKLPGDLALGVLFFWKFSITASRRAALTDHFIPELFFDYVLVRRGAVACAGQSLPPQSLRTLHTRPLTFTYTTPLVLYGARLSLDFAEHFWEPELPANVFLPQAWASPRPAALADFAAQLARTLRARRARKAPYPMLTPALDESAWLAAYSPRHKRRLYQSVFGLSRQQLLGLRAVHAFLEQTCDFGPRLPRIIGHVNPEVFYDQPHLNRTFKKFTGRSPLEYFETSTLLQDNLMAASYNAPAAERDTLPP